METKVTKHYFEYGTMKYFRGKAENVQLACFGEKKDPVGAQAHLEVQNKVKSEYMNGRARYVTTTTVNWSTTNEADFNVNGAVKFFSLNASAAQTVSFERTKSGKLELVKFAIDEGPLQAMLNNEADAARKYLAEEGADGRIVNEVWVVVEGELSEHFRSSSTFEFAASAKISGVAADISVTARGGKHGSQTIVLSPGTTFAYLMSKVKEWNKDKTKIENMEADYKGMQ